MAQGGVPRASARQAHLRAAPWHFAVSGDSRNCGDVVMPGIAAGVLRDQAAFYWHLGDFRAIYAFDEDIEHQPEHLKKPLTISDYESLAWQDFIDSQLTRVRIAAGVSGDGQPRGRAADETGNCFCRNLPTGSTRR